MKPKIKEILWGAFSVIFIAAGYNIHSWPSLCFLLMGAVCSSVALYFVLLNNRAHGTTVSLARNCALLLFAVSLVAAYFFWRECRRSNSDVLREVVVAAIREANPQTTNTAKTEPAETAESINPDELREIVKEAVKEANPQPSNSAESKSVEPIAQSQLASIAASVSNLQYKTKVAYQAEIITEMDEANQQLSRFLSNHFKLGYVLFTLTDDKQMSRQVIPFKNAFSEELAFDWDSDWSLSMDADNVSVMLPTVTINTGSFRNWNISGSRIIMRRKLGAHVYGPTFAYSHGGGSQSLELVIISTNYDRVIVATGMATRTFMQHSHN